MKWNCANARNPILRSRSRLTWSRCSLATASHLLIPTTTARPASSTCPARCASCSVIACSASSRSTTTLASSIACSVLITENFSIASNTLPRRRTPAVSISVYFCPVALEVEVDCVAGGARFVERDHALLAEDRVDERGLADVGTPDDRDLDRVGTLRVGRTCCACASSVKRCASGIAASASFDHAAHVLAVRRRDRDRLAQPQFVELGNGAVRLQAFGLVDGEHHRPARLAQQVGDVLVLRRQSVAAVDQENDDVAIRRSPGASAWPFRAGCREVATWARSRRCRRRSTRWSPAKRTAVVAVPRQTRKVRDERVARLGQPIEQRRLADVGPAYDRQEQADSVRQHESRARRLLRRDGVERAGRRLPQRAGQEQLRLRRRPACRRWRAVPTYAPLIADSRCR